ncbi:MAG: histidine phosphatase family protein [Holosporales bacterium]|jgi:broad specificity phosphatase PhoE|nr:histidine phosphatase family protein [Holosporales bacterium]
MFQGHLTLKCLKTTAILSVAFVFNAAYAMLKQIPDNENASNRNRSSISGQVPESTFFIVRHGNTYGDDLIKGTSDAVMHISDPTRTYATRTFPFDFQDHDSKRHWIDLWIFVCDHVQRKDTDFASSLKEPFTVEITNPGNFSLVRRFTTQCPEMNSLNKLQIQLVPFTLTSSGVLAAENAAEKIISYIKLYNLVGVPITILYSPRLRAEQTAQSIMRFLAKNNITIKTINSEQKLDDIQFSPEFQGQDKKKLMRRFPDEAQNYQETPSDFLDNEASWQLVDFPKMNSKTPRAAFKAKILGLEGEKGSFNRSESPFIEICVTHNITGALIVSEYGGYRNATPIDPGSVSMITVVKCVPLYNSQEQVFPNESKRQAASPKKFTLGHFEKSKRSHSMESISQTVIHE